MDKTIKEMANELKIDKQKVYRFVKTHYINDAHHDVHQKDGVMYINEAVQTALIQHFSKSDAHHDVHHDVHQTTSNDAVIDAVIDALKTELLEKNEQIKALQNELDKEREFSRNLSEKLMVLADQGQRLQLTQMQLSAPKRVRKLLFGKSKEFYG